MRDFHIRIGLVLLIFLGAVNCKAKQSLFITDYDVSQYPAVKSHYFAFDASGNIISTLIAGDFNITDNNINLTVTGTNCPVQTPVESASLIISFDKSINTSGGANSHFTIAKYLASAIVNTFPLQKSECTITSFDTYSYLDQDYTTDKTRLNNAISKITSEKGSLYNDGFLSMPSGSIPFSAKGKYSKSIVLITDGLNVASVDSIVKAARAVPVKIFCISLSNKISDDLKVISDSTGGKWFEGIDTKDKADAMAFVIKYLALNYQPCELSWQSELNCNETDSVRISAGTELIADITYLVPDKFKPYIESNPSSLAFGAVLPSKNKTLSVTIIARNSDIKIDSIAINPALLDFTITGGNITSPIILKKNDSKTIDIKYTPSDSTLLFTRLLVYGNACSGNIVLITGGFPNTPPKKRNLTIQEPKAKDILLVGDTAKLKWTGLLPADVIQLEYTINNGAKWDTLDNDINGLEYNWLVPDRQSDSCFIRIIQLWPNNIGQTLDLRHTKGVNSANFSKDGNLVITGSMDSTAAIWNSNNGQRKFILNGHTAPVLWANFDQQDKYAVTASEDGTAIIWDINTGKLVKTLSAHTGLVYCANFSPDGNSVVSCSIDGYAFVWDVATGKVRDTVCKGNRYLFFSGYDPSGRYIIVTDNRGIAKIWDVGTKKVIKTIDTQDGVIPYASFSPDGSKIALASWFGQASIWDFQTVTKLLTIMHPDTVPINSINFDYTGKKVITSGSNDYSAFIWNAETGQKIAQLKEHQSAVRSAVFNFDNSRVLTASWDSCAKIWNLNKRDLQTDTSGMFIIAKANAQSEDIDFGKVIIGGLVDSTISPFVINTSKYPFPVRSVRITGDNASDFSFVEPFDPFMLDTGSKPELEIRFKPSDIGQRKAKLEIYIPGKVIIQNLIGEGTSPGLQLLARYIDFGQVEIGDFKDTTVTAVFRNISTKTINITSVDKLGPDDKHFSILEGGQPCALTPGTIQALKVRFKPEYEGVSNGVMVFHHDAEGSALKVFIFGEGISPIVDTATLALSSAQGAPGDIIDIPVRIKDYRGKNVISTITGFNGEISFNASLLEPLNATGFGTIKDGIRTVPFFLPATFGTDSIIGSLRFRVALGNDTVTDLKLKNTYPAGKGKMVLNEESSKFKLNGLCFEGGIRLFESDGKIYLNQNNPNPASSVTTIDFEVIEKGVVHIYITDMKGELISDLVNRELTPGKYSIYYNTQDLPQGTYFYMLETPSYRTSKKMLIER